MWQDVLISLYYVHRDPVVNTPDAPAQLHESLEQLQRLLSQSSGLLVSEDDISKLPFSMTTEVICLKITSLSIYMQFYFDYFLFRATSYPNGTGTESVKFRLSDVLRRLLQLISRLSNICDYIHHAHSDSISEPNNDTDSPNEFLHWPDLHALGLRSASDPKERDTTLALLFTFARLLQKVLDQTVDVNKDKDIEIHQSAIALARLCTSFPRRQPNTGRMISLLMKRSLFWAGIMVTESRAVQGYPISYFLIISVYNWINDKLQECVSTDQNLQMDSFIVAEGDVLVEFMEKAGKTRSFNDLWTVKAKGMSIFSYNATLATWFFGLNLVKFDDQRVLQII